MVAPFQGILSFFRFLRTKRRPGEIREKRKQKFCILKRKTKRLKKSPPSGRILSQRRNNLSENLHAAGCFDIAPRFNVRRCVLVVQA